jgi:hypothetical protein
LLFEMSFRQGKNKNSIPHYESSPSTKTISLCASPSPHASEPPIAALRQLKAHLAAPENELPY